MAKAATDLSYSALLKLPSVGRLLLGLQIARIAQAMMSVTIVLFTLGAYNSASLAGLATFVGIFPGLLVSPIAGALLDRHGRSRLVVLDYLVALVSLMLIGLLALAGTLPSWLMIVIVAVGSLTMPLSATGLRSLLPLIVPAHLWERANAIDSTGYVFATIIGPPLAASIVALKGGPVAFIAIGVSFGIAAIVIARIPDPPTAGSSNSPLLSDAWQALIYTLRNPTLRGLGLSISVLNLSSGVLNIVVPLIVLQHLHMEETVVGIVIAIQGLTGIVAAILFGRHDTRNRERMMLVVPMFATGVVLMLLLFVLNLSALVLVMAITGFLNGPLDIALFTLRQRRTDPAWTGRAFAVSMSLNYVGTPVGAAIAGVVATRSMEAALLLGVVSCLSAGGIAAAMIPSE